jgi:MFS family permease
VWILDGLEVTIVGLMSEALKPADTGLGLSNFDIGLAGAVYVAGGCLGALVFGQLTDRFGRKKLFLITKIALGYFIGAALMIAGGLVEAIFGVKAERQALEDIATLLTVEDATEAESQACAEGSL